MGDAFVISIGADKRDIPALVKNTKVFTKDNDLVIRGDV